MTPLEAAKVLIFSQNHYDFRNQRLEIVLKRLERLSLEGMKCTNQQSGFLSFPSWEPEKLRPWFLRAISQNSAQTHEQGNRLCDLRSNTCLGDSHKGIKTHVLKYNTVSIYS